MCDEIKLCFTDGGINPVQGNEQIQQYSKPPEEEEGKEELNYGQTIKAPKSKNHGDKKETPQRDLKDYQSSYLRHIEKKNAYRNFDRYVNLHRREHEYERETQKALEETAFKDRQLYQENLLARELDILKKKEYKEDKMRQLLRQNSSELRDLERKLKAAYINKELAAQIAQKEAERANEKIREYEAHKIQKRAWIDHKEHQNELLQEEMVKKAQYKQELQEQLILKEKTKRHLYEEHLREKKLIDDIVQRIHDENEREAYERFCKMKKTRAEMLAFKNAQEAWKTKRKEEIEEENRRIEEYLMSKSAGVQARHLEKVKKEAQREKLIDNIAREICEQRAKQREREEIIADLQEEEKREAIEKRHRADVEKQLRIRLETKQCLAQQMEESQERKREEAEEDRKYKEELLAKLAEDAKLEQLSDQKRRLKMLQMKKDVQQMLKERRQNRAEEFQLLMEIEKHNMKVKEEKRRKVEEERIKMLQEHVKNLIGYLPKGLLKKEDLPHLGSDIVTHVFKGAPSTSEMDH